MDGLGSVLFLVSRQDFPKPRDIYQLKISFQIIAIEQIMSAFAHTLSPIPHPSKREFKHSNEQEGGHLTGVGNFIGIMLIKTLKFV